MGQSILGGTALQFL